MTEYYRRTTKEKLAQVAYWKKHPLTLELCMNQFMKQWEQRIARESRSMR